MGFNEQRNIHGLNKDQQRLIRQIWNYLGGGKYADIDFTRSARPYSLTVYNSKNGIIYIGANVFPNHGPPSPFSKMSARGCIAHELAHAYRDKILNIKRPFNLPEALLEESQTCIDASIIFYDKLAHYERVSLIKGAKIRLKQWLLTKSY